MLTATIAFMLGAVSPLPAPTTPLFCAQFEDEVTPLGDITFGDLTRAIAREYGLLPSYVALNDDAGILRFKGGEDTISYEVIAVHGGGLMLGPMRVRQKGKRIVATNYEVCWRTFSIVNAE